jgi:hypothetical protein
MRASVRDPFGIGGFCDARLVMPFQRLSLWKSGLKTRERPPRGSAGRLPSASAARACRARRRPPPKGRAPRYGAAAAAPGLRRPRPHLADADSRARRRQDRFARAFDGPRLARTSLDRDCARRPHNARSGRRNEAWIEQRNCCLQLAQSRRSTRLAVMSRWSGPPSMGVSSLLYAPGVFSILRRHTHLLQRFV